MNETTITQTNAVSDLEAYQKTLPGPDWLAKLRAAALARFLESEWPTTSEEEWRRTNLSPFVFDDYDIGEGGSVVQADGDSPGEARSGRLAYENGQLTSASLSADLAAKGVVLGDLREVLAREDVAPDIRGTLERSLAEADNRLQYWHFAMLRTVAVLYVPANVAVEAPFEVDVTLSGDEVVQAPHLVAILERGAEASLIRRIHGDEEGEVLVVDGSEFVVSEGARLTYLNLQRLNDECVYFCFDRGNVGRDGYVHRTEASLGSDFVKSRYTSELTGTGADAVLNGIYFTMDEQHMDLRTVQHHRAAHTTSRAFYRGVARDESHAIYQGLIQVAHEAVGTDAYLTNKNLIIGDEARADSIPSLNISTDDVRCSHGSTTGKLDEGQLFYLKSRGIPESEAKRLLVEGYFEDLVAQTHPSVQDELRELIISRIPNEA